MQVKAFLDKYSNEQIKIVVKEQVCVKQVAESRAGKLQYYLCVNKLTKKTESI